jgi:hypothetical protein
MGWNRPYSMEKYPDEMTVEELLLNVVLPQMAELQTTLMKIKLATQGESNPMFGKRHSLTSRKKMSLAMKKIHRMRLLIKKETKKR